MQIKIRKAEKKDCPAMFDLIKELAEYEKAPQEVTVTIDHFMESGFGEKPVWQAIVAEVAGDGQTAVKGFALWYIRYSTWKGCRMYLEDIVVTQSMRGHGLGTQLMDTLITIARENKYSGMVWQVLDWNEPAIHFYEKYHAKFDDEWINCSLTF